MTSDENFEIIKRIETETAKKEADQKQKENIKKEAVMKLRKEKAAIQRKQKKCCLKNKIKPKTVNCVTWKTYQHTARSVKMKIIAQKSLEKPK